MCDTLVIVEPGRVLFAKNSDRDPNEGQGLEWRPRRTHGPHATLRCTWIEIPQATATHAILISRPFWMWGAEMGCNEHGVTIGNEAVFTTEPYAAIGLTGMDLVRLALERAVTAADAVTVISDLLDRYGQGGGCGLERRSFTYHNSFLIADPHEAWVLETAGRRWAVERVAAGARSISNGLTIQPFAETYADPLRTTISACRARRALTQGFASRGPATITALMALLRSHGESRIPHYALVNGAMAAPCVHAGGVLAASQTTGSWIAELRDDRMQHWVTATAAPCTALFKPVDISEPLDLGPVPADRFNPDALWWRHERLHRTAIRDPASTYPLFAGERDAVEARWLADPPDSGSAFAEADRLLARWTERVRAAAPIDTRPPWARRYWRRRQRHARVP